MAIELVIFDMDGLMFDTESLHYRFWSEKVVALGFRPSKFVFSKSMGGHSDGIEAHYEKLFGRKVTMDEIVELFRADNFFEVLEAEGIVIKKGLIELLDFLEDRSIKKAIGSASVQSTVRQYLSWADISPDRFSFIMSGDMAKKLKPDPEIFLTACEKVGVKPENALVLEDSRNGLYAANAAGIPCIFVPDMLEPDDDIHNRAFKVVDSLIDVVDIIREMINSEKSH